MTKKALKRQLIAIPIYVSNASGVVSEIRNMLLESGQKVIFIIKWQRTFLNCVALFYE